MCLQLQNKDIIYLFLPLNCYQTHNMSLTLFLDFLLIDKCFVIAMKLNFCDKTSPKYLKTNA